MQSRQDLYITKYEFKSEGSQIKEFRLFFNNASMEDLSKALTEVHKIFKKNKRDDHFSPMMEEEDESIPTLFLTAKGRIQCTIVADNVISISPLFKGQTISLDEISRTLQKIGSQVQNAGEVISRLTKPVLEAKRPAKPTSAIKQKKSVQFKEQEEPVAQEEPAENILAAFESLTKYLTHKHSEQHTLSGSAVKSSIELQEVAHHLGYAMIQELFFHHGLIESDAIILIKHISHLTAKEHLAEIKSGASLLTEKDIQLLPTLFKSMEGKTGQKLAAIFEGFHPQVKTPRSQEIDQEDNNIVVIHNTKGGG